MSIEGDCVGLTPERLVDAAGERARENVVLVGGDDQPLDRQPHPLGVIAGENVAEIAGRHRERDVAIGRAERDRGGEIIDDLREDARPVDRVDAGEREFVAEGEIVEQRLHDVLAIVERAFDRDRVHARLVDRRHLPALHVGDAPVRIEDEDVGPRAAAEGLDRRRAGVARGRADDGRAPTAPRQRMVHQAPQPLHGEVLERQRRAVEQFEQEQIVVDLDQRRLGGVAEAAIGVLGHGLEIAGRRFAADEGRDDARGGLGVGQPGQRADRVRRDLRERLGRIEAAVAGEAREHRVEKAERRRLAARRNIAHVRRYPWLEAGVV